MHDTILQTLHSSLTKEPVKSHVGLGVEAVSDQSPELAEDLLKLLLLQVEPGSPLDGELDEAGVEVRTAVTTGSTFSFGEQENRNTISDRTRHSYLSWSWSLPHPESWRESLLRKDRRCWCWCSRGSWSRSGPCSRWSSQLERRSSGFQWRKC